MTAGGGWWIGGDRQSGIPARMAFVLLAVSLGLAGCRSDAPSHTGDPALDADVRVSPTPAAVGEARIFVVATDGGAPLEGGEVRVRAFRADDGEPADIAWTAAPAVSGGYGPVALDFPAPGSWWVEAEVAAGADRRAVVRHPLSVVTGG